MKRNPKEKRKTVFVQWVLPSSSAELIMDTLYNDAQAINFDPVLRRKILQAVRSVRETPVTR